MKPQRQLAIPCRPCFVDEMRKGEACVKIPETRLDKLFKTERFKEFLRTHLDWLRPECRIQPNSEVVICRSDILPERIREEDANDRDKRQFEEDFESVKQESTGERAWNLYNEYKQRHVVIDGEDVSGRFFQIALEKGNTNAIMKKRQDLCDEETRSHFVRIRFELAERICKDSTRPEIAAKFREKYAEQIDRWTTNFQLPAYRWFIGTWRHRQSLWGKFCTEFEKIGNGNQCGFLRTAIYFGADHYDILSESEKGVFLVFLSVLGKCKVDSGDMNALNSEIRAFVTLLSNCHSTHSLSSI